MFKIGDRVVVARAITNVYKNKIGDIINIYESSQGRKLAVINFGRTIDGDTKATFYMDKLDLLKESNEL